MNGRDITAFITNVLGFRLDLPNGIMTRLRTTSMIKPHIQFLAPLDDVSSLSFLLAEGTINNETKLIMDMTVTNTQPTLPDTDTIMLAFTNARNVIHDIFIELTKPIYDLLGPVGDDHAV